MRRLLLILGFLLCAAPAHASIAYVQNDGTFHTTGASSQTDNLTHTTTPGNNVAVWLTYKTTTRSFTSVTATGCHFFPMLGNSTIVSNVVTPAPWKNGTNEAGMWVLGSHCPAISQIVVTLSNTSDIAVVVEGYNPNVLSFGRLAHATGSSTACSSGITTQDANNFVITGCASLGTSGVPTTASVGNFRDAVQTGSASTNITASTCDNTSASPGSTICTITLPSSTQWLSESFELRTVNPSDPLLVNETDTNCDCSGSQPAGTGETLYFSEPILSGNAVICGLIYDNATPATLTISDSTGGSNTWQVAVTATGANNIAKIVYALNVDTSTAWMRLNFNNPVAFYLPQIACVQKHGINSLDAGITASAATVAGPNVATGAITPSQAGDLVFQLVGSDADTSLVDLVDDLQTSYAIAPGPGFSPIATHTITGLCFQDLQQGAAAAITPTCDVESSANFNTVSAAFKTDSSGTPAPTSGLYIDHQSTFIDFLSTETNRTVQIPCSGGNLYSFASTNSNSETFTVADSHQNAYTSDLQRSNTLGFVYAVNSSCDMSQKLYVSTSSTGGSEFIVRDFRGAKTSSPVGCQTNVNGSGTQSSPFTAGQVISNIPGSYTPCAAGDMLIWAMQNGCGPPENLSSPTGAITDNVWYSGQGDGTRYTLGEGHGHFLAPNTSSVNFNVVMQNNSANCSNTNGYTYAVWEISPQPGGGGGGASATPTQMSLGVGE